MIGYVLEEEYPCALGAHSRDLVTSELHEGIRHYIGRHAKYWSAHQKEPPAFTQITIAQQDGAQLAIPNPPRME